MIRVRWQTTTRSCATGCVAMLDAEQDIEVVGEAEDGAAAVDERCPPPPRCRDHGHPDAGLDGIEATKRLMAQGEAAPRVLVLTTFDLDEYVFEALRAGAGGFLLKDAPPSQLTEAVRTVAAGSRCSPRR